MSNLYEASNQWSKRPDDERFASLADLLAATRRYKDSARVASVPFRSLALRPTPFAIAPAGGDGADLALVGPAGTPARLTHWAFGQVARAAGAPAEYLRRLPAPLAAQNVNHGLSVSGGSANLLIHANGGLVVRSATSDSYSRIWDCDVAERLQGFDSAGWRVPPARPCRQGQAGARPATEADCLAVRSSGLSVKPGDMIAPAGLYASDHDMFVFMVNEDRRLADGSSGGLSRGFFVSNSEVGSASLKITAFLYRHVCGNHIVWGAESANELRVIHRGSADSRFRRALEVELTRYANASASADEQRIETARRTFVGHSQDEVVSALFAKLRGDLSRKDLSAAYASAVGARTEQADSIDENTVWGMAQGLTYYSQESPHQDTRDRIDRAAGKLLSMTF